MGKFDRQIKFFGLKSQEKLDQFTIAIVGLGGIGSHIGQQLAFLGITSFILVDDDVLENSNKNRLVGVWDSDPEGMSKGEISERLIKSINSEAAIDRIEQTVISLEAYEALKHSDYIFGCVDNDGARHFLNEMALAYSINYIDCASEIDPESKEFGGRICCVVEGNPCLHCLEELDPEEIRLYLEDDNARMDRENIYGIPIDKLKGGSPAVVSLNGIIASLAVNEFLVSIAGIRKPKSLLLYYGMRGIVTNRSVESNSECYYCNKLKDRGLDISAYLD